MFLGVKFIVMVCFLYTVMQCIGLHAMCTINEFLGVEENKKDIDKLKQGNSMNLQA